MCETCEGNREGNEKGGVMNFNQILWLIILGLFIFFTTIDLTVMRFHRKRIKGLESAILRIKGNKKKVEEKYQELKEKYRKLQTTVKELRQNETRP